MWEGKRLRLFSGLHMLAMTHVFIMVHMDMDTYILYTHTHTYVCMYIQTAFKKEMSTFTLHIWSLKLTSVMLSQLLKRLCRKLSQYCFYFWQMKQTLGINHFKEPNSYQLCSVISSRILASLVPTELPQFLIPRTLPSWNMERALFPLQRTPSGVNACELQSIERWCPLSFLPNSVISPCSMGMSHTSLSS